MNWFGLKWEDILLNTAVLAIIPLLLAAWGGHLAAEAITDPKNKRNVKLCFWSLFMFGVVATFWQQLRSAEADLEKDANNNFAMAVLVQKMYPPPPVPTIEWKVSTAGPKSFLAYEDLPKFSGSSPTNTEGAAFSVGDPLGFNIHFVASGPNPVTILSNIFDTEVATDMHIQNDGTYDAAAIKKATDSFFAEVKKEKAKTNKVVLNPHTLMVGDKEFNTAFAWTDDYKKHRLVTQNDLDGIKEGTETWVVISIMTYSDGTKVQHHLRRCTWLMPPVTPPGRWHFCDGFPNSD